MLRPPLLALLFAACAATPRQPWLDKDYPGILQPAGALATDILWQQRVTATWSTGERGFDAAIQKQGNVLTVLGLSQVGAPGFAILLRNTTIELKNDTGQDLPFPPRFILLDVQRTFYPWLPGAPPDDGTREGTVGEERVVETWRAGRLIERRFARLAGEPQGTITITYDWGDAAADRVAPPKTTLDNGWFGYRLVVDTHVESRLPPPDHQ